MSITVRQWGSLSIIVASVMVLSSLLAGFAGLTAAQAPLSHALQATRNAGTPNAPKVTSGSLPEFPTNLTHFVYIVRENHAFDDYLGDCSLNINNTCNGGSAWTSPTSGSGSSESSPSGDQLLTPYLHGLARNYSVFDNMYSSIDPYSSQAHAYLFASNVWGGSDGCASGGTEGTGATTEWGVYNSSTVKSGGCSWTPNGGSQSYSASGGSIFDRFLGTNVPQSKSTVPFLADGDIIWELSSPGCSVASSSSIAGDSAKAVEHVTGCTNGWWKNTTSSSPDMPPTVNTATGIPQMLWECQYACSGVAPTPFTDSYPADSFSAFVADYGLPTYTFIELFDDHPGGNCGQTQSICIQWNDAAMSHIVSTVENSSTYSKNTVVAISEDDTQNGQNGVDHVNDGRRFPFVMVAPHTVMKSGGAPASCGISSSYPSCGYLVTQTFNTSNVLAVMERVEMNVNPNVFVTGGPSGSSNAFPMVQNDYLAEGNPLEPLWLCGGSHAGFCNTGAGTSGPTVTSFSASPNPVTVNSATTFSTTVSGGTAPYTYAYTGLPAGCTSSNTATLACTPTASGSFSVTVTVTDASSKTGTGTTTLTVNSGSVPTVTAFSASPNPVTVNTATTFSATVSGGTTPYSYAYTGLPTGCTSSNTNSLACTPTATGSFNVTVTVTDANSKTATKSMTLNVSAPVTLASVSIQPSGIVSVNPLGTKGFSASSLGSNGASLTSSTTFAWALSGTSLGSLNATSGTSVTFTAKSSTGNVSLCVNGTYNAVQKGPSCSLISITNAPPVLTSATVTPSSAVLGVGATQSFTAQAYDQYGKAMNSGIGYTWNVAAALGTLNSTGGKTVTFTAGSTPGATGNLSVVVTAGAGTPVQQLSAISIFGLTTSESKNSGAAPLNVSFTATAAGGSSPYSYQWIFGDGNTSIQQNPTNKYCSAGAFTPKVTASDSAGHTATSILGTITVTGNCGGGTKPVTSSATGTPLTGAIPLTVVFTGSAQGGTSPYTFSWTYGDGQTGSGSTVSHTYTTAGSFTAWLFVNDSAKKPASPYSLLVTAKKPSGTSGAVAVAAVGSPLRGPAPLTVTFAAAASGGSGSYVSYAWTFGDATSGNGENTAHTYQTAGTYAVQVAVKDSNSTYGYAYMNVTVVSATALSISSFAASPNPVSANSATTLSVVVSGGVSPLTYAYVGLPPGCASSNTNSLSCTPTTAANYTVTVTVTDANGNSASKSTTLTVTQATATPSGTPWYYYAMLGVIIVLAVGIAAVAIRSRRPKTPAEAPPAWGNTEAGGTNYYSSGPHTPSGGDPPQ